MNDLANPRAVIGDNLSPDFAQTVAAQIERDYAELNNTVGALLNEARAALAVVTTDEEALKVGGLIKRLREADKRAESHREAEKAPYKRSVDVIDAFFFAIRDKLGRRNKNDRSQKPGAIDVLQARVDAFLEGKRIAEEEKRRREAAEAARIAAEKAAAEARARQAEEGARLAAERARKPENVAARTAEAELAGQAAAAAKVDAAVAQEKAIDTHIATLAKPADMVRTRGSDDGEGVLLTQAREAYAILVDRALIDMDKLRPYFTDAEVEKALRGWAKATNHGQQMPGAEIGFRRKGQTR